MPSRNGANVNLMFAALLVVGGVAGARKGSRTSLLVALAVAAAHTEAAVAQPGEIKGRWFAARAEICLALAMGLRYLIYGKFMPSGLVAVISFVMYQYNMKYLEN